MTYSRAQPGKIRAAIMAIAVHLLFIALLIFGVSWQNKEQPAVQVELWAPPPTSSPSVQREVVQPPPEPPDPKLQKATPPEPVAAEIEKPDPDIAIKKALKKKEKEEEEKQRLAKAEQKREEQEKLLDEKREREKLTREKQEEERTRAKEQRQQLDAKRLLEKRLEQLARQEAVRESQEKAELAQVRDAQLAAQTQREAQLAAASNSLVNDYKSRIRSKIRRFIVLPGDIQGNPQAEFEVTLMPSGDVLRVALVRTSGVPAYDTAVERAIYKAQPLPLPPQSELFGQFRELRLRFRPYEEP